MPAFGLLLICALAATSVAASPAIVEAQCIARSANFNALPGDLLRAIRDQEGGRVGAWSENADGSIDYGVMQINSRWLRQLSPLGYTAQRLTYDACASIAAGAWILAHALADHGAWNDANVDPRRYWAAVGDYHSHTTARNRSYARQVWARYAGRVPRSSSASPIPSSTGMERVAAEQYRGATP
jgi:soluble lytic murein transglycosylase-like protein